MSRKVNVVKKNPEPAKPANVDAGQLGQYSAKSQISEGSLEQYLLSRGINPKYISTPTKIAHSKSALFLKWKQNHTFESVEVDEEVSTKSPIVDKHQELKKNKAAGEIMHTNPIPRKEGSQTPQMTPEEVQIVESPKEGGRKKFSGMFNPAPKGTFAYDQAMRKKKHDDIEKNRSKDGSGMSSAIDRLQKHMNKEETELDEMDQKFVDSLNKLAHRHKEGDRVTVDSKFFGKQKGKVVKVDNQSVHVQRDGKKFSEKYPHDAVMKEDIMDPQAAIAKVPDTDPSITERKREMSKSARMIKSLYKSKRMVKEDLYDHEKEDKSVATYGKKPKFDKADEKDSAGENKPAAAATMTGGTTLTGEKRDDIEIDPMMRLRPGQPDPFKKDDKKKDDKKDGKKEEKK
jgi:hypothetical protein